MPMAQRTCCGGPCGLSWLSRTVWWPSACAAMSRCVLDKFHLVPACWSSGPDFIRLPRRGLDRLSACKKNTEFHRAWRAPRGKSAPGGRRAQAYGFRSCMPFGCRCARDISEPIWLEGESSGSAPRAVFHIYAGKIHCLRVYPPLPQARDGLARGD